MSTKTQYALIFCLLITVILGLGVVSATDNTNITDTNDLISSESLSSDADVNENINTNEIKKSNIDKNTKLNADNNAITVNNYGELYNQVISIRNKGTATSYTLNLNSNGNYVISDTIIWGTYNGPARNLTINGNGATIDGKGSKSFLTINTNYSVTLNNLNIINNYRTNFSGGGAIFANGNLTINNCNFTNCKTVDSPGHTNTHGGAIRASNVILSINNSIFKQNSATSGAGAVVVFTTNSLNPNIDVTTIKPTLFITNSQFISNVADHAGAVNIEEYIAANITNCTFTSNKASDGGAINTDRKSYLISTNNKFINNVGTKSGAAIYTGINATTKVVNNTFTNNQAIYGAGIINQEGSTLIISDSTFTNNKATGSNAAGGAIHNTIKVTATINKCTFNNNNASVYGGSISNIENNIVTISNSQFNKNIANKFGGTIYNNNKNTITIKDSTFTDNTADTAGGAIANINNNKLTITNTKFNKNIAKQNGGVIFNQNKTTMTIKDSIFIGNTATTNGGVLYTGTYSNITTDNTTFNSNKATLGGAICSGTGSNVTLINSQFNNNKASNTGHAIFNPAQATLILKGNTYINDLDANILNDTIKNNGNLKTEIINSKISIKSVEGTSEVSVKGILTDEYNDPIADGNVIVKFGSKSQTVKTDADGNYIANYSGITSGTYNVTATFNKNARYNTASANTTKTINVPTPGNTSNAKVFMNSMNVLNGKYVITTKIVDDKFNKVATGRVSYRLDGKWIGTVNVNSGSSWISFNVPTVGNHSIVATYINTDNKEVSSDTYTFEKIVKVNQLFNQYNVKNGKVIIVTALRDDNGGNITGGRVSYRLDGKWIGSIDVKDSKSWISFNYANTTPTFQATYIGNNGANQNIYSRVLNLSLMNGMANGNTTPKNDTPTKNSSVHIMINSINVLNGKYVLTTKVTDDKYKLLNVGRVSYTLDGKWIGSIDVSKGSSWISFNVPAVGNHTIVATYLDANGKKITTDTYTFEKIAKVNALWNAYNVKNGKVIVTTAVKTDTGANINSGRVSYNFNGKWIGSIDVKNGSSWISFNYAKTTSTFKATYIASNGAQQNIFTRSLDLEEISKIKTAT